MDAESQNVGDDDLVDPLVDNETEQTPDGNGSGPPVDPPPVTPPPRKPHPEQKPFWLSDNLRFYELPKSLQLATKALIQPAYDELVLGAQDALEKSAGMTAVYFLWWEVLGQIELAKIDPGQSLLNIAKRIGSPEFEKHLKLITAKMKTNNFLLRLKEFRAKYGHLTPDDDTPPFRPGNAR